ncbi:MAG: hypothetical protein HOB70_04815 [Chloroflexi bacterium]|nr:hypothetical protein [Chloroflexota bacterium]
MNNVSFLAFSASFGLICNIVLGSGLGGQVTGASEIMIEIPIAGKVDRLGEIHDFPENHGHFATLLIGADPEKIFALAVEESIPSASILSGDLLICDFGKKPQPGDMAIFALGSGGENLILCDIHALSMDKNMTNLEVANEYPMPEELINKDLEKKYHWAPVAFDGSPLEYIQNAEKNGYSDLAIYNKYVVATVLRLTRNLAF